MCDYFCMRLTETSCACWPLQLLAGKMHHLNRFPRQARQAAVVAFILSFLYLSATPVKLFFFRLFWNSKQPEGQRVSTNHELEFINKWGERWFETGELTDLHGGGMPVKVPPEIALEAVTLVKSGFETYVEVKNPKKVSAGAGHHRVRVHRF